MSNTANFITPSHFGPIEANTVEEALQKLEENTDGTIVKLEGSVIAGNSPIVPNATYLVVPGSVAKGGFDGGA